MGKYKDIDTEARYGNEPLRPTPERPEALFDVDETLIMDEATGPESTPIELDYYGMKRIRYPHNRHIQLIKAHYARGFKIVVHSANGKAWAEQVVSALGVESYVDECKTKPVVMFDDKDAGEWCPRVWVEDK